MREFLAQNATPIVIVLWLGVLLVLWMLWPSQKPPEDT